MLNSFLYLLWIGYMNVCSHIQNDHASTYQALSEMTDVAVMFVKSEIAKLTVCVALIREVIHGLLSEVKVTARTDMTSIVVTEK